MSVFGRWMGLLAVASLVGAASCITASSLPQATEPFEQTQELDQIGAMLIRNPIGNVTVRTANVTGIQLSATKIGRGITEAEAADAVTEIKINVAVLDSDPDILEVTVTLPQSSGTLLRSYAVDWEITVPASLRVSAEVSVGNVTVSGVAANVNVNVDVGNADLMAINGNATVRIKTGEVTATVSPSGEATIDLETDVGNVDLRVPASVVAKLDAQTNTGEMDAPLTEFDASNVNRDNDIIKHTVTADLNGGASGTIRLATDVGNVTFRGI